MKEMGSCLWLTNGQAVSGEWDDLRMKLLERGVVVKAMTVGGAHPFPAQLDRARDAYAALARRYGRTSVVGVGAGATAALILAQQYPVSALTLLAPVFRSQARRDADPIEGGFNDADRGEGAYRRLAARNLFAIVAPTLIVANAGGEPKDARAARKLYDGLPHGERRLLWLGGPEPDAAGEPRDTIFKAIIEQLRPTDDTNSLAN